MKRVGGFKWIKFRAEVIRERGKKCQKCGYECEHPILDHIKPIAIYGREFDKSNVQVLCPDCNRKKTSQDLSNISFMNKRFTQFEIRENFKISEHKIW